MRVVVVFGGGGGGGGVFPFRSRHATLLTHDL